MWSRTLCLAASVVLLDPPRVSSTCAIFAQYFFFAVITILEEISRVLKTSACTLAATEIKQFHALSLFAK